MGDFELKRIKDYLMTGISYMIPVCIIGGMFFAISIGLGGHTSDAGFVIESQFWKDIQTIGLAGFGLMPCILGAYIAYAIAGKPALAPGFVLSYLASQAVGASGTSTGFLGAMLLGLTCGILVSYLKKVNWPDMVKPIVPVIIIPLITVAVIGILYIEVLAYPIGLAVGSLVAFLENMSNTSLVICAMLVGVCLAVDMGGPINKTCTVFLYLMVDAGRYEFFAFLAAGACIPAIGMGLATLIGKSRYTENERVAGFTSLIMGCMGLTEGAIPLAVPDPLRVIPSICVGGAVGNALVALFGVINYCPHGGLIVIPAITGKLMYLVAVAVGSLVTAVMVNILKKPIPKEDAAPKENAE